MNRRLRALCLAWSCTASSQVAWWDWRFWSVCSAAETGAKRLDAVDALWDQRNPREAFSALIFSLGLAWLFLDGHLWRLLNCLDPACGNSRPARGF
jgi:hypothetical protein